MNVNIISDDSERINTHTLKSIAKQHNGVYLDASSRMMESGTPEDILKIANRPEYLIASRSDINNQQIFLRIRKIKGLKFDIAFIKLSRDDRIDVRDMIHEKESLIADRIKLVIELEKKSMKRAQYGKLTDYQKKTTIENITKLSELRKIKEEIMSRHGGSISHVYTIPNDVHVLHNTESKIIDTIDDLEVVLPGSSVLDISQVKGMRMSSGSAPNKQGILAKYTLSSDQKIVNINNTIEDINNRLEKILPGSSDISLKQVKAMRPAQLGIKDYNIQMDEIIPDTSQLKRLYPTTPYYDDLSTYEKEKLAKLVSENESLGYELKSLESRKITKPSTTKRIAKNIDRLKARLHTIMVGQGRRKPGIEEILPASLVDVNRLRTPEGRKSVPGFDDLPKGKRTLFGVRARMYIECYDELQAAEKAKDKYLSADTAITTRSNELLGLISECVSDIAEMIPGSSSLTLSQIKKLSPEQSTIKKMFPSFSLLNKDMQTAYLRIIRLRNDKLKNIAQMEKDISLHEAVISDLHKGIHGDFRYDAVDFANAVYVDVYPLVSISSIPRKSIWNIAYFIACSPNQTICIDHISAHEHQLSPDQLSSLINYLSTSSIDKTIYISSITN